MGALSENWRSCWTTTCSAASVWPALTAYGSPGARDCHRRKSGRRLIPSCTRTC